MKSFPPKVWQDGPWGGGALRNPVRVVGRRERQGCLRRQILLFKQGTHGAPGYLSRYGMQLLILIRVVSSSPVLGVDVT